MIPKNQVKPINSIYQAEHEDSALARRTLLVDPTGESIGPSNGLPVYIVDATASGTIVESKFEEVLNVAIGATVNILTFLVPPGAAAYLMQIEVSGTNIATYDVLVNGQQYARTRTYFGSNLKEVISFAVNSATAPKIQSASTIQVQVTNFRPSAGNFEARLQYILDPT